MDRTAMARDPAMRLAIYDLDKTLTRRPTFTPFLLFAAWRTHRWRVLLLPVWVLLMVGYRLGLYDRTWLKTQGMHLMLPGVGHTSLQRIGREYAESIAASGAFNRTIVEKAEQDRSARAELVMATAAFEFYACAFAEELGFAGLVATRWDGSTIPGGNCYGPEKLRRIQEWMAERGLEREDCQIFACSDSPADAPLLDWADEALLVDPTHTGKILARNHGWSIVSTAQR